MDEILKYTTFITTVISSIATEIVKNFCAIPKFLNFKKRVFIVFIFLFDNSNTDKTKNLFYLTITFSIITSLYLQHNWLICKILRIIIIIQKIK